MASALDVMILAGRDENFYFNAQRLQTTEYSTVSTTVVRAPTTGHGDPTEQSCQAGFMVHAYIADTRTRASDGSAMAMSHAWPFTGAVKGLSFHVSTHRSD